ncbi:MAG TPA: glycosyltransferase family 2 protein [Bacteroidales bacterium]|nr:glycosyltransferase family 2 protein [Bacteroidales bacterium]
MATIKTAIVILNWNGKAYLERFLPSVVKYSERHDTAIVVADNDSKDESVEFLQHNYPQIQIIRLEKNYGFAEGYNRALQQIEARYYVLLNSDVEVTPNWLEAPENILEAYKEVAVVMPKIKSLQQPDYFEHAGAAGGFIDRFGYTFCRGRIFDSVEKDTGQYDEESEVFWATGACMMIRAVLYHQAGGLDPFFFAHMEEIDLCWRLKNMDHKIWYTPHSTVYHVGGGTLPKTNPRKTYLNFRNNLFLIYKNLPKPWLQLMIFTRLVLDGISALMFLSKGSIKEFSAVFKAHIHFYKAVINKDVIRSNSAPLNKKKLTGVYSKSLVLDYFIRNKHRFSDMEFKV